MSCPCWSQKPRQNERSSKAGSHIGWRHTRGRTSEIHQYGVALVLVVLTEKLSSRKASTFFKVRGYTSSLLLTGGEQRETIMLAARGVCASLPPLVAVGNILVPATQHRKIGCQRTRCCAVVESGNDMFVRSEGLCNLYNDTRYLYPLPPSVWKPCVHGSA